MTRNSDTTDTDHLALAPKAPYDILGKHLLAAAMTPAKSGASDTRRACGS